MSYAEWANDPYYYERLVDGDQEAVACFERWKMRLQDIPRTPDSEGLTEQPLFHCSPGPVHPVSVLEERGLLDAPTLLRGLRRRWLTTKDVEAWALRRLMECPGTDDDLVELTSADSLFPADIEDLLTVLTEPPGTTPVTVSRRWALAMLVALQAQDLPEDELQDRLEELYGELGYPEELRWCSRYDIRPEELARAEQHGVPLSPMRDNLEEAVETLVRELDLAQPRPSAPGPWDSPALGEQ